MKKILLILTLGASVTLAQTALTQTTLSSAISASQTRFAVASVTGISAPSGGGQGTYLYVLEPGTEVGEVMVVSAISGTTLTVIRGYMNRPVAHPNGALAVIVPTDGLASIDPRGTCNATSWPYTPYINVNNGDFWVCSTLTGTWVPSWNNSNQPGVTAAVASVAGTVTPSGPLFHITGALAITGFTLPVGFVGGGFCVVPDGTFTTTTATNIALASTAVVNRRLCFQWDSQAVKWTPTY